MKFWVPFHYGSSQNLVLRKVSQSRVTGVFLCKYFLEETRGHLVSFQIGEISVNCLLYADDIDLLPESKSGLQNCLNILETYCSNWKLQVNVEKSKVLILN
jgi:hypothetical protein